MLSGTGVITKTELKYFYTAFMDMGKLGDEALDEITDNAFEALTSVTHCPLPKISTRLLTISIFCRAETSS